jgi:hypothetical protein
VGAAHKAFLRTIKGLGNPPKIDQISSESPQTDEISFGIGVSWLTDAREEGSASFWASCNELLQKEDRLLFRHIHLARACRKSADGRSIVLTSNGCCFSFENVIGCMQHLALAAQFCEPIVPDDALKSPLLNLETYKDMLVERNSAHYCAWAKCGNPVRSDPHSDIAVYCSSGCQFINQQFGASLVPGRPDSRIGAIVERFPDQRPPKPLTKGKADEIEGFRVRVGPDRATLDAIEKWFGGFRVFSFKGMTEGQTRIFELVNECLKPTGAELKRNQANVEFFVNIDVKDPTILTKAPRKIQMAFALAIYELLTDAEVRPALASFQIPVALYEDMLGIVSQAEDDDAF